MTRQIYYRPGYKYQLERNHARPLPWYDGPAVHVPFVTLLGAANHGPMLVIHAGYAWDGPSGPTFDTPSFMRGSLVHDALYQLLRAGKLPESARRLADRELVECCREDGMSWVRRQWVYAGVRWFAGFAARRGSDGDHPIKVAP